MKVAIVELAILLGYMFTGTVESGANSRWLSIRTGLNYNVAELPCGRITVFHNGLTQLRTM